MPHTVSQENIWEASHLEAETSHATLTRMSKAVDALSPEQVAVAVWAIRQTGPGTPQERLEAVLDRLHRIAQENRPALS